MDRHQEYGAAATSMSPALHHGHSTSTGMFCLFPTLLDVKRELLSLTPRNYSKWHFIGHQGCNWKKRWGRERKRGGERERSRGRHIWINISYTLFFTEMNFLWLFSYPVSFANYFLLPANGSARVSRNKQTNKHLILWIGIIGLFAPGVAMAWMLG